MVGIYFIVNICNGKLYIGSTNKSFEVRFRSHLNALIGNYHENPILQNSWNKYGKESFLFIKFKEFNLIEQEILEALESKYIKLFNVLNRNFGYNICNVGKSRLGSKWSEESRLNRSGKNNPMYGKGYLRVGELNPMYGKSLSKKHKERMSKSLTGIKKPIVGEKLSKPIIQYDKKGNFIKEFKSITEAYNKTQILHISEVCNNLRKSAGGFKWKFK